MSGPLSDKARKEIRKTHSSDPLITLITFESEELDEPLRLSDNPTQQFEDTEGLLGTVSKGNRFYFAPFSAKLPREVEGGEPRAQLSVGLADHEVIGLVRSINRPLSVRIQQVFESDPDTIEIEWVGFTCSNASYTEGQLTLDLVYDVIMDRPFPKADYGQHNFPGLYR